MYNKPIRPWRLNYTVTYADSNLARDYREPILSVLKNVARLRGIECAIDYEYPFYDEAFFEDIPSLRDLRSDLVYFRSLPKTKISRKDFRLLIDHIFDNYAFGSVEVASQLVSKLKEYPYPEAH